MSDSERLCPGDKVTLLLPDHVVMVEVEICTRTYFEVTLSSRGAKTYQSKWPMSEEGNSWLRGYHLADSPAVDACRAAQGLEAKPKTEEIDHADAAQKRLLKQLQNNEAIREHMLARDNDT